MKNSRFNNYFNYEDKKIGYNAYSNQFIILDPELYEILMATVREDDLSGLKEIHPDFYDHLTQNGFFIDSDIDEIARVKDLVHKVDIEDDRSFRLIINPTMNCNFKCWYCYESHIKGSKMSEETLISVTKFIDNVVNEMSNLKTFNLGWFGGEPLLYFKQTVKPIIEYASEKMKQNGINFTSGFTTNGYLINQEMLDVCVANNATGFQITLDGDRERHNKVRFVSKSKGSYDEIVANIKLCLKNKCKTSIRLNISEETIDGLSNILNDFLDVNEEDKKYMNFSFHEVWQEEKDIHDEVQEIVNSYRNQGFKTMYKGVYLDTVRNSCYADKKNQATLNFNGEVYKCTARDFTSKSKEGVLNNDGEILWNEKYHKRLDSKFKNPPCLECSILPICNGGCSQQALEHEGVDYCIHNFDDNKKRAIIKDKFLYALS